MKRNDVEKLISAPAFARWIRESLESEQNVFARDNQGTILKYSLDEGQVLVKCPMGQGLVLGARKKTLLREYEAYRKMEGLSGVPECYGLVEGEFMVIELVRGVPFREAVFRDRERWFARFLEVIRSFHERGISHGDLKTKSNILVAQDDDGGQDPCVIDFGTAVTFKAGFHPFNNWMFRMGRRLDLNAWVKHKYHGRYQDATGQDREILRYSGIERIVRKARGGGQVS